MRGVVAYVKIIGNGGTRWTTTLGIRAAEAEGSHREMSKAFPSVRFAKKNKSASSTAGGAVLSTITVPDDEYGAVYSLSVDVDVNSQAALESLNARALVQITIGAETWAHYVHPFVAHDDGTNFFRHVDLGPWSFTFPEDGFYSGVVGDNITVTVTAMGTGTTTHIEYFYTGD